MMDTGATQLQLLTGVSRTMRYNGGSIILQLINSSPNLILYQLFLQFSEVDCLQVSWYIAEFWNTVTNLSMIIPPIWGIHKCLQRGLETRYLVGFLALLLVGIGSTMFHMTLQ